MLSDKVQRFMFQPPPLMSFRPLGNFLICQLKYYWANFVPEMNIANVYVNKRL